MLSGWLWISAFVFISLAQTAFPIKCLQCKSDVLEEACDAVGKRVTCSEENAAEHFRYLQRLKKELVEPRRNEGYQCMKIKVGNHRLVKGCIYANMPVCVHFRKRTKLCSTCLDNDCNSLKYRDYYLN
ncbi:uncharacterized protein LOC129774907 [Toxorhynchites rutilus septentrionalis]|uniref:uncharacterized protein LOC129774907 n=1 Tax=Toxorhynchites rutilus septentrionalis TaxID=329112 RepID=UPI002479C3CE|nr:uncharacterized protein LOC129774907 [Toxorhynchites rutilus septentrionalis]